MKRLLALVLSVLVALPGCALQSRSMTPRFGFTVPRPARGSQEVTANYASQLPVGRRVEVALKDGSRFRATFMGLEGNMVRLQKRTRVPENPVLVPLDQVVALALDEGGTNPARAILIGVAVGAATFFGLMLLAYATLSD